MVPDVGQSRITKTGVLAKDNWHGNTVSPKIWYTPSYRKSPSIKPNSDPHLKGEAIPPFPEHNPATLMVAFTVFGDTREKAMYFRGNRWVQKLGPHFESKLSLFVLAPARVAQDPGC